jgi:hypothetical protein
MSDAIAINPGIRDCGVLEAQLGNVADQLTLDIQRQSDSKKTQLEQEMKKIQDDMPNTSGVDAAIKLDIKVEWENTDILIPVIEFRVDWKEVKLDLPQVKMSNKEFIFHTPSVRMVNKKVGQYPEFRCRGFKCSVKWSDIITKVPETFMEEQRIVMGIPEFWVDTTSVRIPELKIDFSQKKIVLGLPQIKVTNIEAAADKVKNKSEQLSEKYKREFEELAESSQSLAKASVSTKVHELFECHRSNLHAQKETTIKSIEAQIQAAQVNLDLARSKNIGDAAAQIESAITALNAQKTSLDSQFETMLSDLQKKEKDAIREMVDEVEDL